MGEKKRDVSLRDLVEHIIEERPDCDLAQEPMNSFRYKLAMLVTDNFPTEPKEASEIISSMAAMLCLVTTSVTGGNVELTEIIIGEAVRATIDPLRETMSDTDAVTASMERIRGMEKAIREKREAQVVRADSFRFPLNFSIGRIFRLLYHSVRRRLCQLTSIVSFRR